MLKTTHTHTITAKMVKLATIAFVFYILSRLMLAPSAAAFVSELLPTSLPNLHLASFFDTLFGFDRFPSDPTAEAAATAFYSGLGNALFSLICLFLEGLRQMLLLATTTITDLLISCLI